MVTNAVLEDLRMIFNFKMDSSNPFILILSGQPLIRSKLALNINNPLKQRISIKYVMQGLKKEELSDYCKIRLKFEGKIKVKQKYTCWQTERVLIEHDLPNCVL